MIINAEKQVNVDMKDIKFLVIAANYKKLAIFKLLSRKQEKKCNMSEKIIISQTNYEKGTRIVDVYLENETIDVQKYNVYVYRFKELSEKFRNVSMKKVNEILENN